MIIRFDPAARRELIDVVEWYAARDVKAAKRFVVAVETAIQEIAEFPGGPPPLETWSGHEIIRRVRLHRFPYLIVFEVLSDVIIVWSISHTSRKSNHWQDRRQNEGRE